MSETMVKGDFVSCGLASLEVTPEPTSASVSETSSGLARAKTGFSWGAGASSDIGALGLGSTEADSWIGAVDGSGKDVRRDASEYDPSGRGELALWSNGIAVEAQFVVVSASAEVGCTRGFSESSTFSDAEATTAALEFWMRVKS